nr:g-type lectin s-receptor-like serine/threonine-protein kinase [Quercus suber]
MIFHQIKKSVISRGVWNESVSSFERYIWVEADKRWITYGSEPKDKCDTYNLCGPYGNCIIGESPICQCVEGFKHKSPDTWNPDEWSKGCVRITQLSCEDKDKIGFAKFVGLKMPDTTYSWVNGSMNLNECRVKCLNNCSCTAYANSDIKKGGSGCAMWFGDLIDIKQFAVNGQDTYMQDVYIRMPASEQEKLENNVMIDQNIEGQSEDMEVTFFTLATIATATDNFSSNNKLGEGGFGLVYKGTLVDGKEIAVKRLSRSSGQGLNEFKNETEGNTRRVVGTYGYMAPEYAINDHSLSLVEHAWKLWKEGRPLELIDTCLEDSGIQSKIIRCLHISFLCLQQHHDDRPNMLSVVMLLHSEGSLPKPRELGFFVGKKPPSSNKNQPSSVNEITITMLEAR